KLLRNDGGNRNHWLTVAAKLPNGKSDAVGARIRITAGSQTQIRDLIPTRGYLSQSDPRPHFGLGRVEKVDRLEIRWPDGRTTQLSDVSANQALTVVQPAQ
ncbi:MAG TPA: ASPIC/UnbV domain-containing protein, partial [Candidatus Anammoximicrobium sp.]|nr:ASPIC/UnbV domain-containing protein [Candidatus Anammoximicrobium sp.]